MSKNRMKLFKKDIIVSVDIEATGTSPTCSSCVMIGCVAMFDFQGKKDIDPYKTEEWLIDRKAWCIKEQPNRPAEKDCWDNFWLKNMNVWEHIQKNAVR